MTIVERVNQFIDTIMTEDELRPLLRFIPRKYHVGVTDSSEARVILHFVIEPVAQALERVKNKKKRLSKPFEELHSLLQEIIEEAKEAFESALPVVVFADLDASVKELAALLKETKIRRPRTVKDLRKASKNYSRAVAVAAALVQLYLTHLQRILDAWTDNDLTTREFVQAFKAFEKRYKDPFLKAVRILSYVLGPYSQLFRTFLLYYRDVTRKVIALRHLYYGKFFEALPENMQCRRRLPPLAKSQIENLKTALQAALSYSAILLDRKARNLVLRNLFRKEYGIVLTSAGRRRRVRRRRRSPVEHLIRTFSVWAHPSRCDNNCIKYLAKWFNMSVSQMRRKIETGRRIGLPMWYVCVWQLAKPKQFSRHGKEPYQLPVAKRLCTWLHYKAMGIHPAEKAAIIRRALGIPFRRRRRIRRQRRKLRSSASFESKVSVKKVKETAKPQKRTPSIWQKLRALLVEQYLLPIVKEAEHLAPTTLHSSSCCDRNMEIESQLSRRLSRRISRPLSWGQIRIIRRRWLYRRRRRGRGTVRLCARRLRKYLWEVKYSLVRTKFKRLIQYSMIHIRMTLAGRRKKMPSMKQLEKMAVRRRINIMAGTACRRFEGQYIWARRYVDALLESREAAREVLRRWREMRRRRTNRRRRSRRRTLLGQRK